jgi:hypothetical protein
MLLRRSHTTESNGSALGSVYRRGTAAPRRAWAAGFLLVLGAPSVCVLEGRRLGTEGSRRVFIVAFGGSVFDAPPWVNLPFTLTLSPPIVGCAMVQPPPRYEPLPVTTTTEKRHATRCDAPTWGSPARTSVSPPPCPRPGPCTPVQLVNLPGVLRTSVQRKHAEKRLIPLYLVGKQLNNTTFGRSAVLIGISGTNAERLSP